jgi:hypothetical protein
MPLDFSISPTAAINLWVEDVLTRDYLRALWETPISVAFRLGGGNDGVDAIVKAFAEDGHQNVFGVVDRDFRLSQKDTWLDPNKNYKTFVIPVHEIENYLLVPDALKFSKYHNRHWEVADFSERMLLAATRLCWWVACRDVIAELKKRFREPFLPDPKQSVVDEPTALAHICGSPWFSKLALEAGRSSVSDVAALLAASHLAASKRLQDGSWLQEFSGKEIFKDVVSWMCDEPRVPRFPRNRSLFYADIAKGIAEWQIANSAVPADLANLFDALKMRISRKT